MEATVKVDESVAMGEEILTVTGNLDEWRKLLGYNAHSTDEQVKRQVYSDVAQADYLHKHAVKLRKAVTGDGDKA